MNKTAKETYESHLQNVKSMLEKLQNASEQNFGWEENRINWTHTGTVAHVQELLERACEFLNLKGH